MPTCETTARNSSGCCVSAAPMRRPPFEPPSIASLSRASCSRSSTSRRAQARKSSNTFCLCVRLPARCHSSPNSPPPRRFAVDEDAARARDRRARGRCSAGARLDPVAAVARRGATGFWPSRCVPFCCRMMHGHARAVLRERALARRPRRPRSRRRPCARRRSARPLSPPGRTRNRPAAREARDCRRRRRSPSSGCSLRPRRRPAPGAPRASLPSRSYARTRLLPPSASTV